MDRRGFLKSGALAAATAAFRPQAADARQRVREFTLENSQLAWHLQSSAEGIRSVAFENRISGRRFALQTENEFRLIFSNGQRIEIPWWDFRLTDENPVSPERESGLLQGFHRSAKATDGWKPVNNLSGGQHGRTYGGYGWFRCNIELPASAKGKDVVLVLGGYDEQDWNDYWVYLNGQQIGRRTSSGRWRTPGRFTLRPSDSLYVSLRFGSSNLLAVRTRGYNFHLENISQKQLDRYVFRPWLFDQFASIEEPFLPISKLELLDSHQDSPEKLSFNLYDAERHLRVTAHYQLEGFLRRKWLEISNESEEERLLLDVEVDAYQLDARRTDGGHGDPVFVDDEVFLAVEHPAGINQATDTTIRLWHSPGKKIQPGKTLSSLAAVVGVAPHGRLLDQFHRYINFHSPGNRKKHISLFTCYGINNQWGGCPALSDVEVLNCQEVLKTWQAKGVKLDYLTLDQGWPDNDGDLTEFADNCFPDGPDKIIEGAKALDMQLGLWFSVSGGAWSDGSYPPVQGSAIPQPGTSGLPPTTPPVPTYRSGYPTTWGVGVVMQMLCLASDPYFNVLKRAIEYHVQHNEVRIVKLDGGDYYCNSTAHQHMPGRYSTEAMFDRLIDIAASARAIAPEAIVIWYWGTGSSPFWALYGHSIFESGLFMEGSGTSWYPTLYYRDSVTLALDQSTVFASLIPPANKDSLGVWVSQVQWANFMGRERWREGAVMDLGRGTLLFPQIWGDPHLLSDDDLRFLSGIMTLVRNNEEILFQPRRTFGDVWTNEPYGYAFFDGGRGFAFCNNVHFASRKLQLPLGPEIGLSAISGAPLQITSHFPERMELKSEDGAQFQSGMAADIWMRPFETLLLEIGPSYAKELPPRRLAASDAAEYGRVLELQKTEMAPWMDLIFADASRFEKLKLNLGAEAFSSRLPILAEGRSILAIHIKLIKDGEDYRYAPVVADIIQIRARLADHNIQLVPVPDSRQFGNTQYMGCSWTVYKIPLSQHHSEQLLQFSVHWYLPDGVKVVTAAWVVKQWWEENTRPAPDGYFSDPPAPFSKS